jgi:tetratricopeptide (TPR) repeat protein
MHKRAVLSIVSLAVAFGQHHAAPPEKPVALLKGLGSWHHPIATKSPEAQKFFDQGLALLYGFNRYEALRSFAKATELDPDAAMAWWGMAMSLGPSINMEGDGDVDMKRSCAAVDAARKLTTAPAEERAWIDALAVRCPEYQPAPYIAQMRALAERFPDDPDAATLYAESLMLPVRWHWYDNAGKPAEGVLEAERVLEEVLRRVPDHPGANHFYIHAVESSPTPERAIPSAQRLMGIVPGAGHLVHMPGHIWMVLGEYEMAATVNDRAAQVDREYMAATGVTQSAYVGYYIHNLHFVAAARAMQGRMQDAIRAADEIAAAVKPMAEAMPEMVDAFGSMQIFARVRFQRWDDVLAAPAPPEKLGINRALRHWARAQAFQAKGKHAEAVAEQAAFTDACAKLPPTAFWGNNKPSAMLAVAAEVLSARLAGSPVDAVPHWQRAVELQDALVYDEPPAWYYPVRESLGGALLRAGKVAEAEAVFREGLRRSPRDGRMLFGLRESLRAQKKVGAADWVEREYREAWKYADVTLRIEEL